MEEQKPHGQVTSEFAVAALVMGIVSFINLSGLEKPIAALVFGALALRRIAANPDIKGKKLAIWGISLAAIAIVVIIVYLILFVPQILQQLKQIKPM